MRDDCAALACGGIDVPGEILLDGYRKAGVESTVDTVVPSPLIRIAIVRVQYGLIVIQKIQIRTLPQGERGRQDERHE
jgi:hypothetical protein